MQNLGRTATLLFAILFAAVAFAQQNRGPSTPEERTRAVQYAHDLESNPLGPQARSEREWLTRWLIEVPDITVGVCSALLGSSLPDKKNFGPEILSQLINSEAAFVIENPDKANDKFLVYTAGVSGALKVYEIILKDHPKAHSKGLDDLIARRDKGELQDHVREAMKSCKN
jgi:hypothetical protein